MEGAIEHYANFVEECARYMYIYPCAESLVRVKYSSVKGEGGGHGSKAIWRWDCLPCEYTRREIYVYIKPSWSPNNVHTEYLPK